MSKDISDSINANNCINKPYAEKYEYQKSNFAGISERQFSRLSPYLQYLLSDAQTDSD